MTRQTRHSPDRFFSRLQLLLLSLVVCLILSVQTLAAVQPVTDPGVIFMEVTAQGIQRVTYEELMVAGIDLADIPHNNLALTRNGNPVALRTLGQQESAGSTEFFGPGGWIEFIGETEKTLYRKTSAYALHVDPALRITIYEAQTTLDGEIGGDVVDHYQEVATHEWDRYYSSSSSNQQFSMRITTALNHSTRHTLAPPV